MSDMDVRTQSRSGSVSDARPTEYQAPGIIDVIGATAADGLPYVCFKSRRGDFRDIWVSRADLGTRLAEQRLRDGGLLLFGDHLKNAMDEARRVSEFPHLPLLTRAGWTGNHFALPSGEVFSPTGAEPGVAIFEAQPRKCEQAGDLKAWCIGVRRLAAGQDILTFCLAAAVAGPLMKLHGLHENFGFQLSGDCNVGTALQLAGSVYGGAVESGGINYQIHANALVHGIEPVCHEHADATLIIEEMDQLFRSETARMHAKKRAALLQNLQAGTPLQQRVRGAAPARFVYLTSSSRSIAGAAANAYQPPATNGLLAIPLPAGRRHGIFDRLPKGYDSETDAVRALQAVLRDHHGVAIRQFLQNLVEAHAADARRLNRKIGRLVASFRRTVGVEDIHGEQARVAEAFGLVYAAGLLAKWYNVISERHKIFQAVRAAYRLHVRAAAPPLTNLELLYQVARDPAVITVDPKRLSTISDAELEEAPALLRRHRSGVMELLMTGRQFTRRFGSSAAFFRDPEVAAIAVRDSDQRNEVKRTFRAKYENERVYAFVIDGVEHPEGEEEEDGQSYIIIVDSPKS